jgi:cytochrome c553
MAKDRAKGRSRSRTWLRRGLIGIGALFAIVALALVTLYAVGASRLGETHDVRVSAVAIPDDADAVSRGRHLARAVLFCTECHGENLQGQEIESEPGLLTFAAPNLTSGRGGVGAELDDEDWVRAIRHGVNRDGRGMLIMHADAYNHLTADDLGAVIAFARSVPPVDNEPPAANVEPLGVVLFALGLFDMENMPFIPAEVVDHDAPVPDGPAPGPTPEYGDYLVTVGLCRMCHGATLRGAPPIDPSFPSGPNISVYGVKTREQLERTLRTGTTPDGRQLDGEFMPYRVFQNMTDEEIGAIWQYLARLEAEG